MNLGTKILSILAGAVIVLIAIGYFIFKMPVSTMSGTPSPMLPAGEAESAPPPSSKITQPGISQNAGAYSRLLGESEFDESIFGAEIIDASLLAGEKPELASIAKSYDEITLPSETEFCSKISDIAASTIAKIDSRNSIFMSRKTQLYAQITNGRIIRDEQKKSIRLQNSASRDRYVERLTASSAKNAVHRTAVDKFISLITDAINNRRTAVNAAQQAFRQELDEAKLAREGLLTTAIMTYKNSVNSAFEKAKSDCSSGTAPATVRTNLQTSLKSAHDQFVSDQSASEKLFTNLQAVVIARKSAISKALSDFKLAMENARKSFKASFPQGE